MPKGQKACSVTGPVTLEHLAGCAAWWSKPKRLGREECDRSWKFIAKEIKERSCNLDIKNPYSGGDGPGDPELLLAELNSAKAVVPAVRSQL